MMQPFSFYSNQMSALYGPSSPGPGFDPQQQQYCLKWNNHTANMVKVFKELLSDSNFVDVTLACDGVSIKAHKLVLSACSSYFRELFINNPCKHPIVILKDIHYEDLQAIIHFMYSGEVNVSCAQLGPLLKTAEALKVKGLTDVSEKHGSNFLNGGAFSSSTTSNSNENLFVNGSNNTDQMTNFYNRMAIESLTNQTFSSNDSSNAYFAFVSQQFRKKRRKHKNGSALALANVLNSNGNIRSNVSNGFSSPKSHQPHSMNEIDECKSNSDNSSARKDHTNSNGDVLDNEEIDNAQDTGHESGDDSIAIASLKRFKESTGSSESVRSPSNGLNTQDDDDDNNEEEGEGRDSRANCDPNFNGDNRESSMVSINDSDDEFYPDVKPIVSLDESPSPTNSTIDDSSSFNSSSFSAAIGPILENSLTGSNLPNNSTKVCVCHLCHLTFTAYSSLRRHMTRHYADRERYECDICLKSYSRKDYLKEHKKLKHSEVAKILSSQRSKQTSAQANPVS
ncbi:Protein bric-a-brac 1 [Sarcoptes scabiei]|uniref:Protein bric-a-brac 1 n=1 Tax=Sarcoptes scabiei TaxID=52283 RepID=A0A834RG36_SARSC|nr:Protein bric-a-brac 1 [Sarcoptes scabiei]